MCDQKRNSRISIKLFDKHPGQFPKTLRDQVRFSLSLSRIPRGFLTFSVISGLGLLIRMNVAVHF